MISYDPSQPDCPDCLGPRTVQPCDRDEGTPVLVCDMCRTAVPLDRDPHAWIPAAVELYRGLSKDEQRQLEHKVWRYWSVDTVNTGEAL